MSTVNSNHRRLKIVKQILLKIVKTLFYGRKQTLAYKLACDIIKTYIVNSLIIWHIQKIVSEEKLFWLKN